jgi:hypothetical protein
MGHLSNHGGLLDSMSMLGLLSLLSLLGLLSSLSSLGSLSLLGLLSWGKPSVGGGGWSVDDRLSFATIYLLFYFQSICHRQIDFFMAFMIFMVNSF